MVKTVQATITGPPRSRTTQGTNNKQSPEEVAFHQRSNKLYHTSWKYSVMIPESSWLPTEGDPYCKFPLCQQCPCGSGSPNFLMTLALQLVLFQVTSKISRLAMNCCCAEILKCYRVCLVPCVNGRYLIKAAFKICSKKSDRKIS